MTARQDAQALKDNVVALVAAIRANPAGLAGITGAQTALAVSYISQAQALQEEALGDALIAGLGRIEATLDRITTGGTSLLIQAGGLSIAFSIGLPTVTVASSGGGDGGTLDFSDEANSGHIANL